MVQYSFTSTETRRLARTDSPGRPPRLSHSSRTMTAPVAIDVYNGLFSVSPGRRVSSLSDVYHGLFSLSLGRWVCSLSDVYPGLFSLSPGGRVCSLLDVYHGLSSVSPGRRMCPGESLARMQLFLFLSAMVQRFVFLPPEDGELPSFQGILGSTFCPQPFRVRAVPRK